METVVLAHNYQRPEVQVMADVLGDSLELAMRAAEEDADRLIMCGVDFMAEVVKVLNPDREVAIPDPRAKCSLAMRITADDVREIRRERPDAAVVAYVNTPAEVKAEADVVCTSANAVEVVSKLPEDEVVLVPDTNLASWVDENVPDKEVVGYPPAGCCPVHQAMTPSDVGRFVSYHPNLPILAHPECPRCTRMTADHVGSTSQMYRWCEKNEPDGVILLTEEGLGFRIKRELGVSVVTPGHAVCPDMKVITADKLEKVISSERLPEYTRVEIDGDVLRDAQESIEEMLRLTG